MSLVWMIVVAIVILVEKVLSYSATYWCGPATGSPRMRSIAWLGHAGHAGRSDRDPDPQHDECEHRCG